MELLGDAASLPGIGFPKEPSDAVKFSHGWFLPTHIRVFSALLKPETAIIVEVGSWYGSSTKWLAEHAPQCKIFAIDTWDDDLIRNDNHYNNGTNDILVTLNKHPLYSTFLANLQTYENVIPIRRRSIEGLHLLHERNICPDIIYIDADHHYEAVKEDISTCLRLFPSAIIVGDDYGNYEDVRKAVNELAQEHLKTIHVDNNHCWAYVALDSPTGRHITPKPKGGLKNLLSKYSNIKQSREKATNNRDSSDDGGDKKRAKTQDVANPVEVPKEEPVV